MNDNVTVISSKDLFKEISENDQTIPVKTKTVKKLAKVTGIVKYPDAKRNDPCPCDSGKKYKKCCGPSDVLGEHPKYPGRHFRVTFEEVPVEEKEYVIPTPWVIKKNGVVVS